MIPTFTVEIACCRQNWIGHFSPILPCFTDRALSRRGTWSASGDDGETKIGAQRARSHGLGASGLLGPGFAPTLLYSKHVHHHTFNWINQPDAATSHVYYLSFKYSSTCFWRPHAHHQELQQLQWQPLVYRRSLVIALLLVVVRPVITGPTTINSTAITKRKNHPVSRWVLHIMRNVLDKTCTENQNKHFMFSGVFTEIAPFMR
jgi:hypothetical protein